MKKEEKELIMENIVQLNEYHLGFLIKSRYVVSTYASLSATKKEEAQELMKVGLVEEIYESSALGNRKLIIITKRGTEILEEVVNHFNLLVSSEFGADPK